MRNVSVEIRSESFLISRYRITGQKKITEALWMTYENIGTSEISTAQCVFWGSAIH